jgi:hypothetical protein
MKINRLILKFSAILFILFAATTSCNKEGNAPAYSYFVSKELAISELPGVTLKNEYYLLGYSQGGRTTLAMIQSGTSGDICKKVILPGLDHGNGIFPCMIQGILFLLNLNSSK